MTKKYKHTLNLPHTDLPIKLKPQREEELLKLWNDEDIYNTSYQSGKKKFVLHSGPPYANGLAHHGHILNIVLKDIVCKFHTLTGYSVDFKMGFDCHGLPIELAVEKKLSSKKQKMSKAEFRQECREHAKKYSRIQLEQFERLGIIHDKDPYFTMNFDYEAQTLKELAKFVQNGLLYRNARPIYWCPTHRTALANSEVEHQNHISPSIYFLYKLNPGDFVAVWTTTPWTLPGNQAIACDFKANYIQYRLDDGNKVWVATKLLQDFLDNIKQKFNKDNILIENYGKRFCGEPYHGHFNYGGYIIHSDHVNLETGTGFVHIAPAHGEDDFKLGKIHKLSLLNVIGNDGKTVNNIGITSGLTIDKANDKVIDYLYDNDLLLRATKINHKYPYSDRSNKPVITKTTTQWFIHLDKPYNNGPTLRQRALEVLDKVKWVPEHSYNRIKKMIKTRPDWCLSRQRTWGVPITALKCSQCDNYYISAESIEATANLAKIEGFDFWFKSENSERLCSKCNIPMIVETDILDVWFDSGVSNAAVMEGKQVDLYLEGSDQHRGWFQSTLLAALGARELVPYKTVLTHGFVVNNNGEKLAKSKKNYEDPFKSIKQNGAELFRLWVASSEFKNDIKVSKEILDGVKQTAHKIRNTVRYMIATTNDFDISRNNSSSLFTHLDRYILNKWNDIFYKCLNAYKNYELHTIVKNIENFCILELSSFYFEAVKDRLYCSGYDWGTRRAAQHVLYLIAHDMIQLMSPIMSFTMDDAWRHLTKDTYGSVFLSTIFKAKFDKADDDFKLIDEVRELKSLAYIELEKLRNTGKIGSFVEANVTFTLPDKLLGEYNHLALSDILCVSNVYIERGKEIQVKVKKANQAQCQRCWKHSVCIIGDVCGRCASVLNELGLR